MTKAKSPIKKKNPFGKMVDKKTPYAVYLNFVNGMEHRVLKTYQRPDKERTNEQARWMVAAKSPMTHNEYEYGDTYCQDIRQFDMLISCTTEWGKHYGH